MGQTVNGSNLIQEFHIVFVEFWFHVMNFFFTIRFLQFSERSNNWFVLENIKCSVLWKVTKNKLFDSYKFVNDIDINSQVTVFQDFRV